MTRIILILAALAFSGPAYAACSERIDLTDTQVDGHMAAFHSAETSDLEKIRAFNELCRSNDPSIRALAVDAALESGGPPLRATLLTELLLERETLILEPYDNGNLSDDQMTWIEGNPPVTLSFIFKDAENSCIGLTYSECRPGHLLDYSGIGITVSSRGSVGELTLNEAGDLEGAWTPDNTSLRIPVRARLR